METPLGVYAPQPKKKHTAFFIAVIVLVVLIGAGMVYALRGGFGGVATNITAKLAGPALLQKAMTNAANIQSFSYTIAFVDTAKNGKATLTGHVQSRDQASDLLVQFQDPDKHQKLSVALLPGQSLFQAEGLMETFAPANDAWIDLDRSFLGDSWNLTKEEKTNFFNAITKHQLLTLDDAVQTEEVDGVTTYRLAATYHKQNAPAFLADIANSVFHTTPSTPITQLFTTTDIQNLTIWLTKDSLYLKKAQFTLKGENWSQDLVATLSEYNADFDESYIPRKTIQEAFGPSAQAQVAALLDLSFTTVLAGGGTLGGLPDTDRDGLPDVYESVAGTDPRNKDSDGDGILDGKDILTKLSKKDSDGDGLDDVLEGLFGTDPQKKDTDGDGFTDGDEIKNGYNPNGPGKLVTSQ